MNTGEEMIPELPVIAPKPRASDRRVAERRFQRSLLKTLTGTRKGSERRKTPKDRRATPRVPLAIRCEEWVGTSRCESTSTDLSTFGVSTKGGALHPVGLKVDLVIYLEDGVENPVEVRAQVVGRDEGHTRFAFRRPRVEAIRRIHKYLSRRG